MVKRKSTAADLEPLTLAQRCWNRLAHHSGSDAATLAHTFFHVTDDPKHFAMLSVHPPRSPARLEAMARARSVSARPPHSCVTLCAKRCSGTPRELYTASNITTRRKRKVPSAEEPT